MKPPFPPPQQNPLSAALTRRIHKIPSGFGIRQFFFRCRHTRTKQGAKAFRVARVGHGLFARIFDCHFEFIECRAQGSLLTIPCLLLSAVRQPYARSRMARIQASEEWNRPAQHTACRKQAKPYAGSRWTSASNEVRGLKQAICRPACIPPWS